MRNKLFKKETMREKPRYRASLSRSLILDNERGDTEGAALMCNACHEENLRYAQDMKEMFPDLLRTYSVEEVREIWEWYSNEHFAAEWLGVYLDNEEEVQKVFTVLYRKEQQS